MGSCCCPPEEVPARTAAYQKTCGGILHRYGCARRDPCRVGGFPETCSAAAPEARRRGSLGSAYHAIVQATTAAACCFRLAQKGALEPQCHDACGSWRRLLSEVVAVVAASGGNSCDHLGKFTPVLACDLHGRQVFFGILLSPVTVAQETQNCDHDSDSGCSASTSFLARRRA